MLQVSIQTVSSTTDVCCNGFYLDVAYVAEAIHICCKRMFQMFYMLQMYITESALMLQVFHDQTQVQVAPMCTCVSFTYKGHSWMLHC
jgi:hypothetical protein